MKSKLLFGLIFICFYTGIHAQVPVSGLVGYWPFNGNANDESGNGNNGTVSGAILTSDRFGNSNSAFYFDGIDDYIGIAPSSLVDNQTNATLSFWIKREALDQYGMPIHTGNQGRMGVQVFQDSVQFSITTNSSYDGSAPSEFKVGNEIKQTNWNHVVGVYDGSAIKLYINGKFTRQSFAEGNIWTPQASYLAFGVYFLFGSPNHGYYKGILDDVRLYQTTLDSSQVKSLYYEYMCSDTIVNDTTTYYISNAEFENSSPKLYFDAIDQLKSIYGCDSTVNRYNRFVYQPNYCTETVFDTTFISVTDTLIIDAVLTAINYPENKNIIKIYPNPAKDHITIDYGNFSKMESYMLKIVNSAGLQVFSTSINQQQSYINLSDWSGKGIYFVHLIDGLGNSIEIRKIIIQ